MSLFDKITAALTPPESDEDRREAHTKARGLASESGWLAMALDHHEEIERTFDDARQASSEAEGSAAVKKLATLLTAHSIAEEVVLYPTLVIEGHKAHATMAYEEQTMAKVQMAELERLTPLSQEWRDKLEHIRGAVLHHIYEEESTWFPELVDEVDGTDQVLLDERFSEEFERSMGETLAS